MTYSDEIELPKNNARVFAVLNARWVDDGVGWVNITGDKYYKYFPYGDVTLTGKTRASTSSLSDGVYFLDAEDKKLYFDFTGYGEINLSTVTFPTWPVRVFVSTFAGYWHVDPADDATDTVYYQGNLLKSPMITHSNEDSEKGFFSITSSQIILNNADQWFNPFLSKDISFNNHAIAVYHQVGELIEANVKQIYRGLLSNVTWSTRQVEIRTFFEAKELDKDFFSFGSLSRYTTNNIDLGPAIAAVDPTKEGQIIPRVYGYVENIPLVNINYDDTSPTTSENRMWGVCIGSPGSFGSFSEAVFKEATVVGGSTTTRTYIDDASGIQIGDSAWVNKGTDEYRTIVAVNYSLNYVEHAAYVSGIPNPGDTVNIGIIGKLSVTHNGTVYDCHFNRDFYFPLTLIGIQHVVLQFRNNFEANVGIPEPINPDDIVLAQHVYGNNVRPDLSAVPFGTISNELNTNTDSVSILYDALVKAGITNLDDASFTALESDEIWQIGFRVPFESSSELPTYKDVIEKILKTTMCKLFIDSDLNWGVARIKNLSFDSLNDKEASELNIEEDSIKATIDYADVYRSVNLKYLLRETGIQEQRAVWKAISTEFADWGTFPYDVLQVVQQQSKNGVNKELTVETLLIFDDEADEMLKRLTAYYSEPKVKYEFSGPFEFFEQFLNRTIRLTTEKQPGYEFVSGTSRSVDTSVISLEKGIIEVNFTADSQRSVSEFSDAF